MRVGDLELVRLRRPQRLDRPEALRGLSDCCKLAPWRPLGDIRLLRDADRLERRHPRASSRASSARSAPTSCSTRYHEVEPRDRARAARALLPRGADARRCAASSARPPGEEDALARSLPAWQPFPEVPAALEEARARGWRLAILSNTDRDFIEASMARSACRSTWRSSPPRSARTSRRTATGARSSSATSRRPRRHVHVAREPLPRHRARRTSSACRPSGSTGSASSARPAADARAARPDRAGGRARRARPARDAPAARARRRSQDADARRRADRTPSSRRSRSRPSPRSASWWLAIDRRSTDSWLVHGRRRAARGGSGDAERAGATRLDLDGYVHPDLQGAGSARRSSTWLEEETRRRGSRARPVRTRLAARRRAPASCSTSGGYDDVRHFYGWRSSSTRPPEPAWPAGFDGLDVRAAARSASFHDGHEEAFADHWGHVDRAVRGVAGDASARPSCRSRALVYLVRDGDESRPPRSARTRASASAGSTRSACGGPGGGAGSGRAAPARLRRALRAAASGASGSASTRRTRPARRGSTSASACASPAQADVCEKRAVACVMSRLRARCPDCRTLHRGRDRARVRVPRLRARRSPPGSSACRAPGATGGEAMAEAAHLAAAVPRGGRRRGGHARRADARGRGRPARAAARPRRLLLRARRRGRGARRAPRAARRRLARRARRPEHAGELAVRQRVGDAAADAHRLRRGRRRSDVALVGARNLDPPEGEFIARAASAPARTASTRRSSGVDGVYVALDADVLDRASCRVVHAGAGRPHGSTTVEALLRRIAARRRPSSAPASPGSSRTRERRAARRACAPRSACNRAGRRPGLRSRCRWPADRRLDRAQGPPEPEPAGAEHPNTCPSCGSHYRDDELEQHLGVCPQCGHHFPRPARERGSRSSPTRAASSRRPTDLRSDDPLDFFDLRPYTERLAEAELKTGLGDAIVIGRAAIDGEPCELAVMDFALHGRLDGQRRRREVRRAPASSAAERGVPLVSVTASGGARMQEGILVADADAEDRVRGRGPARRALRDDQRDGAPDDRRRARELRDPRRRDRRRAGRADLVRRPARRPADDAREAARRLRPRRVEPALRPPRRDRPAARAAALRSPGCSGSSPMAGEAELPPARAAAAGSSSLPLLRGARLSGELERLQRQLDRIEARADRRGDLAARSSSRATRSGRTRSTTSSACSRTGSSCTATAAAPTTRAIVAGLGSFDGRTVALIGHQKGRDIKERTQRATSAWRTPRATARRCA